MSFGALLLVELGLVAVVVALSALATAVGASR